jgi:hypothetical protein
MPRVALRAHCQVWNFRRSLWSKGFMAVGEKRAKRAYNVFINLQDIKNVVLMRQML